MDKIIKAIELLLLEAAMLLSSVDITEGEQPGNWSEAYHIFLDDWKSIEKYGGARMYFAPPIDYDRNICFDCCMGEFSAKKRL